MDSNEPNETTDPPDPTKERALKRVGEMVAGRWRLEGLLGMGGMASVYEARHRNGKLVAIKILHPELAMSSDVLKRFVREGYAANAVKHPGVVSVLDDGVTDDGLPYLVMEFLEGESLEGRLDRLEKALPVADVLAIGVAALDVLDAAHDKGIVHRDLKPDNVYLTSDRRVKILDFGIARLQDSPGGMSATRSGVAMGTPTFMPREQAHGDVKRIDHRADLWALGATLYFALSLKLLYDATSAVDFLAQLVTMNPRPLGVAEPSVPAPIAAAIDRALQHDLSKRWASAAEMRQGLLDAAREAGITIPEGPSLSGFVPSTVRRIHVRERLDSLPDNTQKIAAMRAAQASPPSARASQPTPPRASQPTPPPVSAPRPPTPSGAPLEEPDEPVSSGVDSESGPVRPLWLLVAALAFLLLGGGVALWLQGRPAEVVSPAGQPPPDASAATSALRTTDAALPVASASGSADVSGTGSTKAPSASATTSARPTKSEPRVPSSPTANRTDLGATRQ